MGAQRARQGGGAGDQRAGGRGAQPPPGTSRSTPPAVRAGGDPPAPGRVRGWTLRRRVLTRVLALLFVVIAGVGTTEVLVLRGVLYSRFASGLRTELDLLAAGAPARARGPATAAGGCARLGSRPPLPVPPSPAPGRAGPAPTLGPGAATDLVGVLAQRGVATAVVDSSGKLLACSGALPTGSAGRFAVPPAAVAALERRGGRGYVTLHAERAHLLAIAESLGRDRAVLVGDLAGADAAIRAVVALTVAGGVVALLLAAVAGWPLLCSALAPLTAVAGTADRIAAGDLDRRVGTEGGPGELRRLGTAFNRMVDRLGSSLAERDAALEAVQASERSMRRLLADASHELRTPVTGIRGAAQVLRLGAASDEAERSELLGHLDTQAARMARLVDDLLVLSRMEGGVPASTFRTVDLGALVSAEHGRLATLAGDHPLRVTVEPAEVRGDPDSLVRVVINLVDNAAKYSPAGETLDLAVRRCAAQVELSVSDHGPGIPPEERERVFDRFYRGDPARTRDSGGSGLGLAIVASVAAEHGGSARVEEAGGGGARVVVRLSLASAGATGPGRPDEGR